MYVRTYVSASLEVKAIIIVYSEFCSCKYHVLPLKVGPTRSTYLVKQYVLVLTGIESTALNIPFNKPD